MEEVDDHAGEGMGGKEGPAEGSAGMSPVSTWLLLVLTLDTSFSVETLCHPGTHRSHLSW